VSGEVIAVTARDPSADTLRKLVADLRDEGIPYELDLSYPCPVRHQTALYVVLGHLCNRGDEWTPLGRRVLLALRRVQRIGKRSRFAGWFHA